MGLKQRMDVQRVAQLASSGLFAPRSLSPDEIRAICAVALMHVPDHRQATIVETRPLYEQIDIALAVARCTDPSSEAA
jgi:hypothetical protein